MAFEVATGPVNLYEAKEDQEPEWKELFQSTKKGWMGWEKHLIEETTKKRTIAFIEKPEATEMGQIFERLSQWKALPYQIIDSARVHDLIQDKASLIAEETGTTKSIAHAVLLKNSWDNKAAIKALSDPDYLKKTFGFEEIKSNP